MQENLIAESLWLRTEGTTRTIGRVLDYMGYKWQHVNEGQNAHQWVIVENMDGQQGFIDSMTGLAGYGEYRKHKYGRFGNNKFCGDHKSANLKKGIYRSENRKKSSVRHIRKTNTGRQNQ